MLYAVAMIVGYLVGSFPTAYLVVRKRSGVDIRTAGSGNVGGYNAATVTGSARAGVIVGVTDGLKGLVVSLAGWAVAPDVPWVQACAILAAVVGHNYPVWLRFKGGRGLATAAGALMAVGVYYTVLWSLSWAVFYRITKDILKANVAATVLALAATWLAPASFLELVSTRAVAAGDYAWFVTALSALVFISHAEVFRASPPVAAPPNA